MDKLKAILIAIFKDKAVWHFADDAGSFFLAAIASAGITIEAPADGNWKPVIFGVIGVVLNTAFNAIRRAWTQDQGDVLTGLEGDITGINPDFQMMLDQVRELVALAEDIQKLDPGLSQQVLDEVKGIVTLLLVKVPKPK